MSDFYAVILAGGNGERFWPLSTPKKPKQFLSFFGGESLIRQSVSRLGSLVRKDAVYVITSKSLVAATRKELSEIPSANIIGEPDRKDTGAAIALGVLLAGSSDDTVIGFFPSDHLVAKTARFKSVVKKAVGLARKRKRIVTIGIKPTYPSTEFGYVNGKTGRFVEKPDLKRAKKYLTAGYLWNAGMFFARAGVFKESFNQHAPDLYPLASGAVSFSALSSFYKSLKRISFDYAVMESVSSDVIPGDFGWDDVGSFKAFDKYYSHDSSGNVREGVRAIIDSKNNICIANGAQISLLGLKIS